MDGKDQIVHNVSHYLDVNMELVKNQMIATVLKDGRVLFVLSHFASM